MTYYKYTIQHPPGQSDLLIAWLAQLPFEAFEEKENVVEAWLPEGENKKQISSDLDMINERIPIIWQMQEVAPQNWNEKWEAAHHDIVVEGFCQVRADFHEPKEGVDYDIIINPKMAFGTAHHETTYMMIAQMRQMHWEGKSVLDLGCGTGVLAILAKMMGATDVLAIDIDQNAYYNTLENLKRNNITGVTTQCGTLKQVNHPPFDVVLANINRKVILDSLPSLHSHLKLQGVLLLSGILISDKERVLEAGSSQGFTQKHIIEKNGWICVFFIKNK